MGEFKPSKEQFDQMIAALDDDGDGKVTKAEFKAQIMSIRTTSKTTDQERKEVEATFEKEWAKIDSNGDGDLQVGELASYYGFDYEKGKASSDLTDEQILEALMLQSSLYEKEKQKLDSETAKEKKLTMPRNTREWTQAEISSTLKLKEFNFRGPNPDAASDAAKDLWETCLLANTPAEVEKITKLLQPGGKVNAANITFCDAQNKRTVLHNLAQWGCKEQIVMILEMLTKVDINFPAMFVNVQDKKGKTAIFYAAEYNFPDLVTLFISRGANLKLKSEVGQTVLHQVVNSYPADEGEGGSAPLDPKLAAIAAKTLGALLDHPASAPVRSWLINETDDNGRTALHIAAFKAAACVEVLLKHGAKADQSDAMGNKPVSLAAKKGRRKSKELLENAT